MYNQEKNVTYNGCFGEPCLKQMTAKLSKKAKTMSVKEVVFSIKQSQQVNSSSH